MLPVIAKNRNNQKRNREWPDNSANSLSLSCLFTLYRPHGIWPPRPGFPGAVLLSDLRTFIREPFPGRPMAHRHNSVFFLLCLYFIPNRPTLWWIRERVCLFEFAQWCITREWSQMVVFVGYILATTNGNWLQFWFLFWFLFHVAMFLSDSAPEFGR